MTHDFRDFMYGRIRCSWKNYHDEVKDVPEGGNNEDSVDIGKTIEKLEESITRLNENLEKATSTEEIEEEVKEEITEEVSTEEADLPLQKRDMDSLKESVDKLSDSVDKVLDINQKQLEMTASSMEVSSDLVYLDDSVDSHLYLTSQVENADINDVYTMTLSIRNVCVLALLLGVSLFLLKLVRSAMERAFNR